MRDSADNESDPHLVGVHSPCEQRHMLILHVVETVIQGHLVVGGWQLALSR